MEKRFTLNLLILTLFVVCSGCVEKSPQPTTSNGGEWEYSTKYSDEFDGSELDTLKWHPNNPSWIGREPALFLPKNVRVEGGELILSSHREEPVNPPSDKYHTFTSSAVKSVETLHYGFYEICARAQNSAISSAFWLYVNDSLRQEEIDIFEICGRNDSDVAYEDTYFATSHYFRFKDSVHIKSSKSHRTGFKLSQNYIIAGLEWNENEIIWYLDGEEIHRCKNEHWFSPETVNFDCETFPTWWGLPSDSDNGGEFRIDYFRFWTKKD